MGKRKPKTKRVKFCDCNDVIYNARHRKCPDCGYELNETTQPAWLSCNHCGDDAVESATGLFYHDSASSCLSCGIPGQVRAYGPVAQWIADDELSCARADCEECFARMARMAL